MRGFSFIPQYKIPPPYRKYNDGNRNDKGYPSGSCNNPTTG
uniref:Uncharacterized protein n=1 Tax=Podoviridae sp. ctHMt20 TaxID=2827728 RepID=A0A8S5SMC4_9CAUD|nr:MAG TPA: hypothetical protein [Podoviridae sp. ctHMt20]